MKTVYLCGGINGLDDAGVVGWREEASEFLWRAGCMPLDPMRRDFRGIECDHVKAIVCGDLFDIQASQFLLVNAARPSWGTAMEVLYAARCVLPPRPRIVVFGAGDKPSPWLVYHADVMCPDLPAALELIAVAL